MTQSRKPPKAAGRSDLFQTPDYAVRYITPYLLKHWTVWESACGKSQIVNTLKEDGFDVVGTDILSGFDFLCPLAKPDFEFDCIVTNPPYSIKDMRFQLVQLSRVNHHWLKSLDVRLCRSEQP